MSAVFTTKSSSSISISVNVGGKTQRVSFIPAALFGVKGESLYSTADEALIEAMKKHKSFGVYFFLKSETAPVTTANKKEIIKAIEDELADLENATIVESVTTKGMAVAYIQGMYGESFTSTTVEEMKREAAKKWNTLFPKWGK